MSRTHLTVRTIATAAAGALAAAAVIGAAPAQAAPSGTTSLAQVLAADGNKLDGDWGDFDVVEKAVYAVLEAKPGSPVGRAGRRRHRAHRLRADRPGIPQPGHRPDRRPEGHREGRLRAVTRRSPTSTPLETVLLYHVVPGATIRYAQAKAADGATLGTAQGGSLKVNVVGDAVRLKDADKNDKNATVIRRGEEHQQGQHADRPRHQPGAAPDRPVAAPTPIRQRFPGSVPRADR